MQHHRKTELLLVTQSFFIVLLLYWMFLESQSNAYFRSWLTQNFPVGLTLLNEWIIGLAITELIFVTGYWVTRLEADNRVSRPAQKKIGKIEELVGKPRSIRQPVEKPGLGLDWTKPVYETIDSKSFLVILVLVTQAVSLWFVTASNVKITAFTANSFYYYSHLTFTYWWGLAATLALFFVRSVVPKGWRVPVDIGSLFLLVFYLIGLPAFTYQDPRFLDAYYHTGNSLDLLNYQGWLTSPNWYVHQFPGVFSFVGQLESVAGIDPFQLMRFYPLGIALVVVFQTYVIIGMYSERFASIASGVLVGGLWFQLHLSPQSLELVLYLGMIYLLVKLIEDEPRRRLWTLTGLVAIPVFVSSHPETPLAVSLGLVAFLVLCFLKSKQALKVQTRRMFFPILVLFAWVLFWWGLIAIDARALAESSVLSKALTGFLRLPLGVPTPTSNVAAVPSYSYSLTILSEQGVSALVWGVGLAYFVLLRKFETRELFLGGLFLAAVSTIPIAVFGRADVLQRSYLFALFPFVILTAWLLERKAVLTLRGVDLSGMTKVVFLLMLVVFSVTIPLTRYGVDPVEYLPGSSLYSSNLAAGLAQQHSVLYFHPEEDGWRFFAGIDGAIREPKIAQNNLANKPGGYVKPSTDPTVPGFNLTYATADKTVNYIVLTGYSRTLYMLRFGPDAQYYIEAKNNYTDTVAQNFNLVYSTGTDQVYANQELG